MINEKFTSVNVYTLKSIAKLALCTLEKKKTSKMARKEFSHNFYPFDLKLCRMVQLFLHMFRWFYFFDFNGFWRENDVSGLMSKF